MKPVITIAFLLFSISVYSQTDWKKIEDDLWKKHRQEAITPQDWYIRRLKEAGSLNGSFSAWVSNIEKNGFKGSARTATLYFPENFQVTKENGNRFAKMYLENFTNDTIEIARIDATIGNMQEYFFINNKWIKGRKNGTSTCGNSYFTQKLPPGNRIYFELDNDPLCEGPNKVKYKIAIQIADKLIESNTIEVKLYDNQLKRLSEKLQ